MDQRDVVSAKKGLISGDLWEMLGKKRVVTFIGAGGKTTCLLRLTEDLGKMGKSVIATTTTKVYPLSFPVLWKSKDESPPYEMRSSCFWYTECEAQSGKWKGVPLALLDQAIHEEMSGCSRFWVIEGDGARERQLKCWASHEPQIPCSTEAAVLVISGELWGKTLQAKDIHRSELDPELLGKVWCPELAWQYILSSPVFYSAYRQMSWTVLFNSANSCSDMLCEILKIEEKREKILTGTPATKLQLPLHLRIAFGDAKEGNVQWCELW